MKSRNRRRAKRWLSLILCLCMVFPSAATVVSAAEKPAYTGGLCEHHPEHTAECGYVEAVEGQPCTHQHDQECGYSEPTGEIPCTHVHDASCGYQEAVAEVPCDKGCVDEDGDGNIDHQEGCAYQPAVEGKPCTHQHDENCKYRAASEGSPCTHVHDSACGYVEAVEGQPCGYACAICSGAQDTQQLSGEDIDISIINPVGYVGQEYNLLEKATVSPEQDGEGRAIQLRITSLKANLTDTKYEWNNPVLKVTEEENINFTVTYEAYVEVEEGGEKREEVLATRKLTFNVYATGEIGDRLEGDNAYISKAYLTADDSTESDLAIRTGTAPWDEEDPEADGNDGTDLDNKVRSFDLVTYTAAFETQVRDDAPYAAYKTGTVHYEFVAEGTKDKVQFEPEAMGWLTAKAEGTYETTEVTQEGKTYQVLRGSYLAEPTAGNPSAIGNSYQEVNVALRVLAMKKGEAVAPQFTFWLEGNSVPDDGLVTGSDTSCATHNEQEYQTVTAPDVTVTSEPRFNVQLKAMDSTYSYVDTFDFSTGNDGAANKDAGTKEGRATAYGVTLQIQGKSPSHGLRGCELPDGSDITLDLKLSSVYRTDTGTEKNLFDDYPLLLWSIEGHKSDSSQADGRIINGILKYAVGAAPRNHGSDYTACNDGGTWSATQKDDTISITISGYQVDLNILPYTNLGNGPTNYAYYNPEEISHYREIQNACFSAGEIWLVQPFYDSDGNYVADKYGSGTFVTTVQDVNLKIKGDSGTALQETEDNTNQMTVSDDKAAVTMYLTKRGYITGLVHYAKYGTTGSSDASALVDGGLHTGKDWVLREGQLAVASALSHTTAEGMDTGVAYDILIKFDDTFFRPTGTYQEFLYYYPTGERTVLFGAKPDKNGWDHNGKEPNENGYDEEMMKATADDLVFFTSLNELEDAGYTCVAALYECRGIYSSQRTFPELTVNGTVNPEAKSGSVYMCTLAAKAWNKEDVQEAAAKALNKNADELTDDDYNSYVKSDAFPSRAGQNALGLTYEDGYPEAFWTYDYANTSGLQNYQKATYDENGFASATGGYNYGDSCLVVDYSTQITKSPNQPGSDEGGKKLSYDMDTSQREVDYVLYPTAVRAKGESSTEGTITTTTVYVEDTLPAGLDYILNSAYYGGTYTSNGGGQAGLVTGGKELLPQITENTDGTTTLLFTLEDVTITPEETTRFEPIYYSCLIGTPGVEETDVVNQQQLLNSVKIWSDDEQKRDFVATNGNYAEQSILISKNRAVSFSKTSDQKIVELGDKMGFTIHHGNNSGNSINVVDIDFLPHNDDGRGTQITGQVVVSELTVQSKELINNFKLYYTTDTAKRNTKASDYTASDFTEANRWTEMKVDADTGAVELPDVTHVIVAVAAVGTLTPNSTLKMHITFEVPDGKPGEYLVNSFGSGEMESNARTYIVNRLLEGVVWQDADKDGLREDGETLMSGVKVTLLQKDANGSYTPYLLNGNPVTVETGKQVDVLTGTVTDNTTGAYRFAHLPQGEFAVKFESGSTVQLSAYTATQANVGTNDTIDSDAVAQEQEGRLVSASIEGIEMPSARQITVQTYESRYHDLGLYPAQINIPVEKVWEDNNDQDGKRPESITVKLLANGKDTNQFLILNKGSDWKGTFTGLNQYQDGKEIVYTIEEVSVAGYETGISGDAGTGYIITNTHTPETITISGAKTWDDKDNQDGKRPESITIRLYANGTELQDKAQTVTKDNGWAWSFSNLPKYENGVQINYTISEDTVADYTTKVNNYDVTNSYQPGKTSVGVTKSWQDNNNQDGIRPESITVKLLANGEDTNKTLTLSKGNSWTDTFSGLDEYADGEKIAYTIEELTVEGYDTEITGEASTGYIITNSHTPETITISGAKTWDDGDNQDGKRPESITIRLYANGTELKDKTLTVTEGDGWAWSFTNLPKYADGEQINYTISEDAVTDYTTTVNGYNITNSYEPGKTSVGVTKSWQDNNNQDGIRPESITVKLLANGEDTNKTLTLSKGNGWTGTFSGLDEYKDGEKIVYTIEEVNVNGYDTVITGEASTGYIITNSHTPETVEVSGAKTWDDKDNQDGKRPESITIRLYANGTELKDKALTVTEGDGWAWSFTNLPKYADGSQINYTISEDAVTDYTTTVNDYDVTNSYTPGKTSVGVTKSWQDNNNQDGIRPESITVKLLANGKDTGKTLILSKGNSWAGAFSDLDQYKDGELIKYTVEEEDFTNANHYETVIAGSAETGYVITNSHTPETVDISGYKTWDDRDNQDGKRPESITIRLYANGTELKDKVLTVTEEDSWTWSFTNLPKYEKGEQINYTISEDAVADYTTTVNGYDVTNSYTPGKTSVGVTKSWQDNNNQDGIRPESITVKLLANGKDTGKTLTLSKGNSWAGTFSDLDEYKDGELIKYTVEEEDFTNANQYETVITGSAETGYVITNSHTPATTEVSGSKTWDDGDNQDGKRPESITIRLYANGVELKDKVLTVTEDNGWAWSFTNLPKYGDGSQISYTISEDAVTDYTTTVNGYDVTNSYTPGKTSVGVTKSWQDNNNQDGIRPESITVKLLANGKDTGKKLVLSQKNSWTGSFADLDEYVDGEKIVYTVEEEDFTNANQYETVIAGSAGTGYVITNSHTPETIDISGAKTWDDKDNQDGKRPKSITIRLYANGVELKDKVLTVTEDKGWAWSFTNLPKYADGEQINYTISEDAVTDYTTTVTGYDVTNSYQPGKTSVGVTKSWQDNNNQDGIRPESITVKLLANGKDTGKKLVLSQKNSWTGSFTDLDEYADGEKIIYIVEEEKVEGYDTVISGNAEKGYVICNSHTPDNPDTPEEPDTPGNSNTPNGGGPQTGDPTSLPLWSGLMAVSGIVLAGTLILARKKRYRGKHTK